VQILHETNEKVDIYLKFSTKYSSFHAEVNLTRGEFEGLNMTTLPPNNHRLLRIDSSARLQGSHSRELGDYFERAWAQRFPTAAITRRDVVAQSISHIENTTIDGMFTPPDQHTPEMTAALAQSDHLIAEIKAADALLITVPMYNFGIPSALKAWIDQISRIGHTFSYDGKSFTGLLGGKKAYVVIAYGAGGYTEGGGFAAANFVEPYLKFLLSFLGLDEVLIFNDEATNTNPDGIAAARAAIQGQMDITLQGIVV
jgi:FMN-dependent NADH-azoreductase